MSDTIFALSSGHGKAGVAVVRISGAEAASSLLMLCPGDLPLPRFARLSRLRDPATAVVFDNALVLWFPDKASFTGEPCVELHVHGGRAVVSGLLQILSKIPGLRIAQPGEFTRRALENGKLDLTQVEALADLIDADTDAQRQQALAGLEGALAKRIRQWRDAILDIKMMIAADIDFSDEGDVGDNVASNIDSYLQRLEIDIVDVLGKAQRGRVIADGFKVAIIGKPNVGKSTLLNALAGSDIAIVSDHAGTTRDVIEVNLDIDGYLVRLFDTAGIRVAVDPVETIGIERAISTRMQADLVLSLDDGIEGFVMDGIDPTHSIRIRTKSDQCNNTTAGYDVLVSAHTGQGLEDLRRAISQSLYFLAGSSEASLITKARQEQALQSARHCLAAARRDAGVGIEIISHHIHNTDLALSNLLGEIGVEEVLGAIFSRFCVGK